MGHCKSKNSFLYNYRCLQRVAIKNKLLWNTILLPNKASDVWCIFPTRSLVCKTWPLVSFFLKTLMSIWRFLLAKGLKMTDIGQIYVLQKGWNIVSIEICNDLCASILLLCLCIDELCPFWSSRGTLKLDKLHKGCISTSPRPRQHTAKHVSCRE